MKRMLFLFLIFSLITSCTTITQPTSLSFSALTEQPFVDWWSDAVFYEIFVRSFVDSDGDGIGDFNGITQKLNYIQGLGVNAIWLMPIHPSPSYHGYDVLNYYAVNPKYGSLEDFKNLIDEAHNRKIKIIIDLVLNHTSNQHPFFANANTGPDSAYRDWYVWSNTSGEHWHPGNSGYYYGFFWSGMPDLNYRNPEVTTQMYNVTRYWLSDVGVDGFRIDAAKHLIEEDNKLENTDTTHEWFKDFYNFYKSVNPSAYTIGEVYGAGAYLATKYDQQMDHIFNFELASGIVNTIKGESNTGVYSAWKFTLKDVSDGNYATFLTNHDQNRVMSVLNGNEEKAKLAAVMLLTSPGTPYIYYGEEIGMQGKKPDEDIRLPMQWSADTNSGFTTGTPWRTPGTNFSQINVAKQENDPKSLLNLYRALTRLRSEYPVLRTGSASLIETGNTGVYAMLRSNGDVNVLVLINLTKSPISDYALSLTGAPIEDGDFTPASLLDSTRGESVTVTGGSFTNYKPINQLSPYHYYIFHFK